jgi:L-seryl-tRNA(Ser) seleniumtransferase
MDLRDERDGPGLTIQRGVRWIQNTGPPCGPPSSEATGDTWLGVHYPERSWLPLEYFIAKGEAVRDIYDELGIPRLINAVGSYTVFGGSRMPPEVLAAMQSAAHSFTPIREFQARVHERLAVLTRNEAAYITSGCAAGLYLAAAAAVSMHHGRPFRHLSQEEIARSEIVVYRAHRNPYDWGIRQLGVRLVEVGYPNLVEAPTVEDLEAAVSTTTVALFYTLTGWAAPGALPLPAVVAVARKHDLPIIVDAAAQLPPVENLWQLTAMGATAVVFSGGKDLRGPQATGLMVGRSPFIARVAEIGFPNYGIGRMLKVGREGMAGLWAAVERYVHLDHQARAEWCEAQVRYICEQLNGAAPGLVAEREFPNEAGEPLPRALLRHPGDSGWAARTSQALAAGNPRIAVLVSGDDGIYINPMTLEDDETELIVDRLRAVLST